MSKKAKSRRKDAYKSFFAGLLTSRTRFIEKKLALAEKVLKDSALHQKIQEKMDGMSTLERAVLQMIRDRQLSSAEDLQEISTSLKEAQEKSAKFKYTPKKI